MKPLEGPVKTVGGMIDQVTDQTTGMVDSAEKTTLSSMGSGAKLMTAMGIGGQSKNESKAGGKEPGQAQGGSKAEGGGDILGTVRSGIHNNLMTLGLINLKKLGMQILAAGAAKITGAIRKMLTPKVKFKLGNETHELWVEKGENRNVVMMASDEKTLEDQIQAGKIPDNGEVNDKNKKIKNETNEQKIPQESNELIGTLQQTDTGVSEGKDQNSKPTIYTLKEQFTKELRKKKPKYSPSIDKWLGGNFGRVGTISIAQNWVWTYHDWEGHSVSYPDEYPDFKSAGMVIQEVPIGKFESYYKDFQKADELAPKGPKASTSTWHHHQNGTTMQEVNAKLHSRFTHEGGMALSKK